MQMRHYAEYLQQNWTGLVPPLVVFTLTLIAGVLVRRYFFRATEGWAVRTRSTSFQILLESTRTPFLAWIVILAIHLAMQSSALPARVTALSANVLLALWILSLTGAFSRLAARLVRTWGAHAGGGALPVSTLSQNLARISVILIGLLILLNSIGISITPVLTALGVGGLAVALALQDTLSNLFAGFYVSISNQIRIGDYIKLQGSGDEGYVTDIGWRSTTVRTLGNNLVLVPNAKLAQTIVTNYHLPVPRMGLSVNVTVSYACDPDEVERILLEVGNEARGKVQGLPADWEPSVRLIPGFADYGLNFSLNYEVREFVDQYLVQHELRKRIYRRFREAGIEIPLPSRTIYVRPGATGDAFADRLQPAATSRSTDDHG